ncbi:Ig-like domain-containing domain [Agriterribacter sp.]|uniref:Ig-like domain-containing domain n=1 Tax=Agriterribacter sp. TaxID=2821509 RepID=UPI002CDB786C|nr:Ig-like domain-containing domain [Agriterribacter sp.]HRO45651.1 Ig-like domain-containing domain [Agriterribacter sp.]HRQ17472.1 Ig-like domain-containing domain [Agriterribacter sp.]
MKKVFCAVVIILLLYKLLVFTSGCAQIIPPTGGPRDSLPPVMLGAVPKDSTLNFTGSKIVLTFDEYVQLDRPEEQLIISPVPKASPLIEAKLKEVTIRIKDTLEENTTYSINFGKALKDINEGNPAKQFTYIFSTGSYIDSSTLSGKVVVAETGRPDSTLIVMLHRNFEDSAVSKEKPRYFTRLDSAGRFTFNNIAPGRYNIFALKDPGGQKMYMRNSDLFAFYDSALTIGDNNIHPVLYAFAEEPEEQRPGGARAGVTAKTATPKKEKKLTYSINLESNQQDLLGDLTLTFSEPLQSFDRAKLHFTDTLFKPVSGYHMEADSVNKLFTLTYPWKEEQEFRLILEKDIAKDSSGTELEKADTIRFKTKKNSDYGRLRIRLQNLDTAQHIALVFYKADKIEKSQPLTGKDVNFTLFRPGDYEIRILYDGNRNGNWDTGSYWEKRQPEKIVSDGKKYTVRPNWDNEITIELPLHPPGDVLGE